MLYTKQSKNIYLVLIIFFVVNLFFLVNFPFIHSDESWLAGLSRTIINEGTFDITEPFYDIYPRTSHAIKIIFHSIQIIVLKVFGYKIFSFRLISLLFGTLSIYFIYKIAAIFTKSEKLALACSILLAVDIQFIYASHFARQEIILLAIFLSAFYYFLKRVIEKNKYYNDFFLGMIIFLSIGIHPNSFIIFLPFVFIYLYYIFIEKKIMFSNLLIFILTVSIGALIFIFLSLFFDPNFFSNYSNYGGNLGVLSSLSVKVDRLDYFYKKLFYQVSGTYFTPALKIQFLLFGFLTILSLLKAVFKKDNYNNILLLSILAVNLAFVLIGRYNQTSIIFIFPLFYLLLINSLKIFNKKYSTLIIAFLIIIISISSIIIVFNNSYFNYDDYLDQISLSVKSNETVLANLNTHFYFDYKKLYDYRNLAYLKQNKLNFSQYIIKNDIEYIIYPEEMDYIYNSRPQWNTLYGNLYPFYREMKDFIQNDCKLIHQFSNKSYGMRIVKYMNEKDWQIKIYKVIND